MAGITPTQQFCKELTDHFDRIFAAVPADLQVDLAESFAAFYRLLRNLRDLSE